RRLAGTSFSLVFKGVPHSEQNLAVGCICWPQLGQSRTNGVPHSSQNFAPSAFSYPQLEQRIRSSLLSHRSGGNQNTSSRGIRQPSASDCRSPAPHRVPQHNGRQQLLLL